MVGYNKKTGCKKIAKRPLPALRNGSCQDVPEYRAVEKLRHKKRERSQRILLKALTEMAQKA